MDTRRLWRELGRTLADGVGLAEQLGAGARRGVAWLRPQRGLAEEARADVGQEGEC